MKNSNRGWYCFSDGYEMWCNGLSKTELKKEELKHGKLVCFIHTA